MRKLLVPTKILDKYYLFNGVIGMNDVNTLFMTIRNHWLKMWKVTGMAQFLYALKNSRNLLHLVNILCLMQTKLSYWEPCFLFGPCDKVPPIQFWVNVTSDPAYMLLLYFSCSWENLETISCYFFECQSPTMHY